MTDFIDRDCDNCVFHDERCLRWVCNYISRERVEKLLEQEPCEDAISREAAIISINKLYVECEEWRALNDLQYGTNQGMSLAIEVIEELPSVTRQTGEWIDREVYDADRWKCSECGRTEPYKENFCPNCGAKMVEPQESEDK